MTSPDARPWEPRLAWIPALALLLGLALWHSPWHESASRPWGDLQLRWLAPDTPAPGVLVLDIDDATLQRLQPELGAWPWPHGAWAMVAHGLRAHGVQAVVLDLVLADARDGGAALSQALQSPGAPLLLAAAGVQGRGLATAPSPWAPPDLPAVEWDAVILPTPVLSAAAVPARAVGVVTTPLDGDGRLRRLPLWHQAQGQPWPALPLAAALRVQPDLRLPPLDAQGRLPLAWSADPNSVPTLPMHRLWDSLRTLPNAPQGDATQALTAALAGRVVYVGSSALLADRVLTPTGQLSGTAVLAQAHAALLGHGRVQPPMPWGDAALILLALTPSLLLWARGQAQPRRDLWAAGWTLLAGLAVALVSTLWARQPLAPAGALLTLLAGLALATLAHQRAQRHRQQMAAQALAAAVAAQEAQTGFLAHVSHEIRTPLTALLGASELLAATPLQPRQQQLVQVFQDAGAHLRRLVDELLDMARMQAGRLPVDESVFLLPQLLQEAVALAEPLARAKGLALRLQMAPGLPCQVRADRLRLAQCLGNLLGNAVKFTASGQVTLRALPEDTAPGAVRLEVEDTGEGIPAEQMQAVFEPFVQADASVTRRHGGSGLGLALVRAIARQLGGEVSVASQPGVGSVFTLRLTLALAPDDALTSPRPHPTLPSAPAQAAPPSRTQSAPRRVLLAEDNEVNTQIFLAMLEGTALEIETVADGLQAWQRLQQQGYDLVFVDVQMPGMDGLSLVRALRAHEGAIQRQRTPVVALTAHGYASDVQASLAAGCDLHLTKPFSRAQLHQALQACTAALP